MNIRLGISSISNLSLSLIGVDYHEFKNHFDDFKNNLKDYPNHQRIILIHR